MLGELQSGGFGRAVGTGAGKDRWAQAEAEAEMEAAAEAARVAAAAAAMDAASAKEAAEDAAREAHAAEAALSSMSPKSISSSSKPSTSKSPAQNKRSRVEESTAVGTIVASMEQHASGVAVSDLAEGTMTATQQADFHNLQKSLHAARTECASLRQKLKLSEATAERAKQQAAKEEKKAAAMQARYNATPPEQVSARIEARAKALSTSQNLAMEKSKAASQRAHSLAGSRLAQLRVSCLRHGWLLPQLHLAAQYNFERWRRNTYAKIAVEKIKKMASIAAYATGQPVTQYLESALGTKQLPPKPAQTPSMALTAAGSRGGPKALASTMTKSSIKPPSARAPSPRPQREEAGPSIGAVAATMGRVGDGAKSAEVRLAKAAAEEALAKVQQQAAAQARSAERTLEEHERKATMVALQLKKTRVMLLHRTLGAHIAHTALQWAMTSKARALAHWRIVPHGGSTVPYQQPKPGVRRPPGQDFRSPTASADARAGEIRAERGEKKIGPRTGRAPAQKRATTATTAELAGRPASEPPPLLQHPLQAADTPQLLPPSDPPANPPANPFAPPQQQAMRELLVSNARPPSGGLAGPSRRLSSLRRSS